MVEKGNHDLREVIEVVCLDDGRLVRLSELRDRIDELERMLGSGAEKRIQLSKALLKIRKANGGSVLDAGLEQEAVKEIERLQDWCETAEALRDRDWAKEMMHEHIEGEGW